MIAILAAANPVPYVILAVAVLVGIIFLAIFAPLFSLWIQALAARAGVGIFELIGMRLRKVNPQVILSLIHI